MSKFSEPRQAGIPTTYAGIRFRSRLEAKWAAFFDLVGWPWEYEPFDCDGWIPDFLLKGRCPVLIDVKPMYHFDEWQGYAAKIAGSNPPYPAAVVGAGLLECGRRFHDSCFGVFVTDDCADSSPMWHHAGCDLTFGRHCGKLNGLTYMTTEGGWACGLCGEHGKHYGLYGVSFTDLWNSAGNMVQWVPSP